MFTRFILIEPSHAGNVGAVARAMKTMGFEGAGAQQTGELVLVRPRWANVLRREETIQRASGANDVLAACRIVETLDEALVGVHHLCATVMTARDFGPPTYTPRSYFQNLSERLSTNGMKGVGSGVAFLFGCERYGMSNEDVYRCHAALSIPTNPQFGSLNLASAVQLIAYEWRLFLDALNHDSTLANKNQPTDPIADAAQVAGLLNHWEQALTDIGYLDPKSPKKLMPRFAQLFNRSALRVDEINILRGIAKSMQKSSPESHQ